MQHSRVPRCSTHKQPSMDNQQEDQRTRGSSRNERACARDSRCTTQRKVFIDGTCLFLLVGSQVFKRGLKGLETLIVGNLETTLLENNFHINSF